MSEATRRRFLKSTASGAAVLGLGDIGFLGRLPSVSAEQAKLEPGVVRLQPEIEPLVRLLEETPRDKLIEEVAHRVRRGLSYREVLAALLLAGVRNVEPRPVVGFKFHAVLVVNSAHLASLSSPDSERWLPIFWALDHFKESQARNRAERDGWRMPPVKETLVPPARKAREAFIAAMDRWDAEAADAAVAGLCRTAGANEVFELFFRYALRDFRAIGHKIIFASNVRRTLAVIGWQHAEPVLRSLAYALLSSRQFTATEPEINPAKTDHPADRPGRRNRELIGQIRGDWQSGKPDAGATADLLATLRTGSDEDAGKKVVELLNRGVALQSIWDAQLDGASELVMRQPGIVALHAVTTTNAARYAFEEAGDDETRRFLLLQNAAFLPLFRVAMESGLGRRTKNAKLPERRIDQLEALPTKAGGLKALEEIFADIPREPLTAARKVLGYLKENPQAEEFMDAARVLIFLKGTDAHDYKFSSAVLEDYFHVSPEWRGRFLAASVFHLRGSETPDNPLVQRVRSAFKAT